MKRILINIFAVICLLNTTATVAQNIRYVKANATGNGSSWSDASGDLQAMINASNAGDQIWTSAGVYRPNRPANNLTTISINNRDNAFVLKEGVKVYGGFAGGETSLAARNIAQNTTILSGDYNDDDGGNAMDGFTGMDENAYHVVVGAGVSWLAKRRKQPKR
jgi:hypothetical protein